MQSLSRRPEAVKLRQLVYDHDHDADHDWLKEGQTGLLMKNAVNILWSIESIIEL